MSCHSECSQLGCAYRQIRPVSVRHCFQEHILTSCLRPVECLRHVSSYVSVGKNGLRTKAAVRRALFWRVVKSLKFVWRVLTSPLRLRRSFLTVLTSSLRVLMSSWIGARALAMAASNHGGAAPDLHSSGRRRQMSWAPRRTFTGSE